MRPSVAICRLELRIMRRDPIPYVILTLMPLVLMAFVKPDRQVVLAGEGYHHANGAEQAVPGMIVLFAFLLVSTVPYNVFRDHDWNLWDRLRATAARPIEIVLGKIAPVLALALVQQALLFVLGAVLFDLGIRGSLPALALVSISMTGCIVAMGLAIATLMRTMQQVNVLVNVGALVLAGIGGALTPVSLLPGWVQAVAPVSPGYWAMKGFRAVILDGGGLAEVIQPVAVLLTFVVAFTAIGLARFKAEDPKSF
jgi:ABC-2 type transport system permease protein